MVLEWGRVKAEDILLPIRGELISGYPDKVLMEVSTDSREIGPGQLFIAIKGDRYDGHDFIKNALEKGASCVIAEKRYPLTSFSGSDAAIIAVEDSSRAMGDLAKWWRRGHKVTLVAITGSTGKTTTKEMTATILDIKACTLKNRGNFNNLIGLPLTILRLKKNHERAVLEMGMNHPGEIGRLTEIAEPDIGLITNVAGAHLEGLKNIRGVARAKTELIEKISSRAMVILFGDDNLLMEEASRFKRKIITYGTGPQNDIRAVNIENLGCEGISFDLQHNHERTPVMIKIPGMHNMHNALAACAVALYMKEPIKNIKSGLERFEGIKGRFQLCHLPGDIILVDDTYNANPYSLKAALSSVKIMAGDKRRIILGLGEMMELGNEAVSSHRQAGAMVAELEPSLFIAIGEHAGVMMEGAFKEGFSSKRAIEAASCNDMTDLIFDSMKEGDLILLKASRVIGLEKVSRDLQEKWVRRTKAAHAL